MGNDICNGSSFSEVGFGQNNMTPYQIHITKPKESSDKMTGMSQIYTKGKNKALVYKGEVKNSKFHGYGQIFNDGKIYYEGEFKNGLFEGWGMTQNYTGQFREGVFDGYGIYQVFQNEDKKIVTFYYEGYFSQGKFNGNGIQIKGAKIPAQVIAQAHNGQGMMDKIQDAIQRGNSIGKKYEAKEIYIGQFAYGFRNGVGRLFKDNKEFNGTFRAGKTVENGTTIDWQEENQRRKKLTSNCLKC